MEVSPALPCYFEFARHIMKSMVWASAAFSRSWRQALEKHGMTITKETYLEETGKSGIFSTYAQGGRTQDSRVFRY